ncbi:glutamate-5-semialdehyde dehydrogenase [Belliella buryatensis]|uniref:Gamma-glutamyl phosphate reductase n=1 Tax=Belliella buryatensis TaxID=1500549 RepID=A0A239CKJ5_9BACT|nr:glutamate-5-semialdehyde dehydrogenase [Belliella buryatensis]SNS20469.1 glutamate-5-semialdehyde dehydrogenase [Belliella buryatensis]
MNNLQTHFKELKRSAKKLALLDATLVKHVLEKLAENTLKASKEILAANQKDLLKMDPTDPKYDRLLLTNDRILSITKEIIQVAALPSPLGKIIEEKVLDNGLHLKKVSVPLGVLGVIYEARPNVTFDVFCIALKSGNGLVLKGSSDASESNKAIMNIIQETLKEFDLPAEAFLLLPPDRVSTIALLEAVGYVDIIIPRGSQGLINYVRTHSKVPVIETGAGIVHTYFDETADLHKGKSIITNAKTRRPSVCNSLDCLIIHHSRLNDLRSLLTDIFASNVEVFADDFSYKVIGDHPLVSKAEAHHFGTEFLSLKMAIKTVSNIEEAIAHIDLFSSKHSEAIISESSENIDYFLQMVDAAAVYANASTAFTDGNQFGMGAEIGISTQKLHARGPMALAELTSYKWIIRGEGQIR